MQKALNSINIPIFPSKRLAQWYQNDYKFNMEGAKIIPHAINFDFSIKKDVSISENDKKIRLTHAGTLLKPRNPKSILNVVCSNPNVEIDFYGPIHKELLPVFSKYDTTENIRVYNKRFSYEFALEKLITSDFLLLIESGAKHNPFLPTKFVDYVMLDKPIIVLSPDNSEVSRLLGEDYPFRSTLYDVSLIEEIISTKIFQVDEVTKANEILTSLRSYFSKEEILNKYKEVLC